VREVDGRIKGGRGEVGQQRGGWRPATPPGCPPCRRLHDRERGGHMIGLFGRGGSIGPSTVTVENSSSLTYEPDPHVRNLSVGGTPYLAKV
jgi:hypothetical protein